MAMINDVVNFKWFGTEWNEPKVSSVVHRRNEIGTLEFLVSAVFMLHLLILFLNRILYSRESLVLTEWF